jgi:hypothetical protein
VIMSRMHELIRSASLAGEVLLDGHDRHARGCRRVAPTDPRTYDHVHGRFG